MSPKRDYENTNLTPFKTLELMVVITGSHSGLPVVTQHGLHESQTSTWCHEMNELPYIHW